MLPGHTPLLAALAVGEMWYCRGQEKTYLSIAFGFAEVLPDRVTILARLAERADEIDLERAEAARKRAEQRLAQQQKSDVDYARARTALMKSMARLQVVSRGPQPSRHSHRRTEADARSGLADLGDFPMTHRPFDGPFSRIPDSVERATRTATAPARTSGCSWSLTAWGGTSPARSPRASPSNHRKFIEETAGADKNRTWPFPFEPTLSLEANRLKAAFRLANRRIAAAIGETPDLRGMATTASALLAVTGRRAWRTSETAASTSSARAALADHHDHSWVEEQVRAGTMSPSAARMHPWRNVVTRALSGGEDPEVDLTELPPRPASATSSAPTACSASSRTTQIADILASRRCPRRRLPAAHRCRERRRRAGQHHRRRPPGRCWLTSPGFPATAA